MLHSLLFTVAQAAVVAQAESGGTPGTGTGAGAGASSFLQGPFFLIIAMVAIMYFLMFRPQQKREKERREMLSRLAKGDKVLTTGGIVGVIVGLKEKTAVLRVSEEPNVKMEFLRAAVSRVISSDLDDDSGENGK